MKMRTFYKSIVALVALMAMQTTTAWAGDVTTVYERGYTTAWASTDIADEEWKGTNASVDTENNVLVMSETGSNGTRVVSKTIAPTANTIITLDAQLNFGGGGSYNNKGTFKFGDNFEITSVPRNKSTEVKLNDSQVKSFTLSAADELLTINLVVNTSTNKITALSVVGSETTYLSLTDIDEDKQSFATGTNFTSLTLQAVRGGSGGASVSLKKIKVQQETQTIATYGYTVNYKEGNNVVKIVTGSLAEGAPIPVLTALDGEGTYEGQHYLIVADAAPVQAVTSNPANNVLNVPVRKPYNTTLNVYRMLDGVKEAELFITKPLTETDDKVANWVYTFPLCVNIDGAWYEATLKDGKFGEEGTFTNDALEKTVDYTLNADIVGFWDESHNGTVDNMNYSGGSMNTYWKETKIGSLEAGVYEMTAMQIGNYGSTLYSGFVSGDEKGTEIAAFGENARSQVFELKTDAENVRLYRGSNGRMDYILLKKDPKATVTISDEIGWATYSNADLALDFTNVSGLKAYAVKVTGNTIALTTVTKAPKGTGLLLQGAKNDYDVPAIATADAVENNDLLPTTGSVLSEDGYVFYGLTKKDDKAVFSKIGNFAPSKGKAYLKVAESGDAPEFFAIAGEVTGISDVVSKTADGRGNIYDLQGRKVANPSKGLYIINGHKVIINK